MAIASDSGDEDMADNEFGNFTISEDDLFFFEEEDEENEVQELTNRLKKQLQIVNISKYGYLYDDPDFMLNPRNFTDSSDDDENTGAAAVIIQSESEDEVEINPYWSKIKVDELQGVGNSMEVLFSDTDSMPGLESVSDSEDSVVFKLTPPNSADPENKERNATLFSDKEMLDLIEDMGDDGLTSFDAAMLVNVEGNVEGIQTELYDSGASCHMSPYRDHFENYVPIAPKSITAADKRYFQAIGKGDLQIKIPNGPSTTTILLKDVLHCPDMGLTLVSIGKITNAGYKVIFRGNTCMIYNHKDKVIGRINAKNGLYRVDHEIAVNIAMAGED